MNFSLELKKIILSHPVTSKQPHKIVQILMGHPVNVPSFQTQDASNELNRSGKGQLSRLLMSFLEDRML